MTHNVSPAALAIIKKMQQNEITESAIYRKIAAFAKGDENKQTLLRLSQEEAAHCQVWQKYTGMEMKPEKGKVLKFKLIARILGFTFAITLLSCIREVIGTGKLFGAVVMPASYQPMAIMTQVPGGFVTLGILLILVNPLINAAKKKFAEKEAQA